MRQPDGAETKKTITHSVSGRAVTTVVVEAFNGVEKTTSQTISTLDGRLLGERDADGNLSEYGYDNLGRLLSHTTCAQSAAYKEVTQYSYPSAARVEVLEPGGIRRAYDYDGRGNVVNEYIAAPVGKNEKTVPWKLMLQREYDNQGRNNAIVHYDYLPSGNGTKTVSQRCDYAYDSRGEVEVTRLSTGEVFVNKYYADVGLRIERQGDPGDLNGKFTEYNVDGSIAWIEWKEGAEITQKREGFQYKAPGLVAAHVTAVKGSAHVVKYVHDYAGRCTLEEHFWTTGDDFSASRLSSLMNKHSGPATQSYTYEYADDVTINEPISVSLNGQVVGLREVDDAGRLLSVTRDGYTESFAYNGASQAPVSKTTADGKILKYTYFKEMGNRVASISEQTSSLKQTFTYATAGSRQSSAAEGERKVGFIHDPFGHVSNYEAQLQAKVAAAQGKPAQAAAAKSITYQRSVGGRLLSEEDAAGGKTDFTYDDHGRRSGASHVHAGGAEQSQLEVKYDRHGRMASECLNIGRKVSEGDKGKFKHSVALSYVYDGEHREISRTLKTPKGDFVITRDYDAGGRLAKTEIKQGKTVLGGRTLTYNREGRLDTCNTSGIWQPQTPKGKTIEKQAFKYDGLGNLTRCESTYEGTVCVSTFKYTGTRLVEVKHSAADFGTDSTLAYDEAGRVVKDQHGKTYEYDALGRRVKVGSKRYTYDPLSKLMASGDGADQKQIIYDDLTVRGEYAVTGDSLRHCCLEGAGVSVVYQVKYGVKRFLVQLMDATGTVVLSHDLTADTLAHHAYTAYGCHSSSEKEALAGFNGEYRDPEHDQYPLGNGYRWYAPDAMRFSAPDSASPFGNGGPHPYAYCDGDPINRQDPTGHIAFIPAFIGFLGLALLMRGGQKLMNKYLGEKATNLINTGIWAGLGVLTALASGGLSLYVYAAVVALSVISFVTAVTSVLISETHPQAAEILGWVSFATTIAAGVVGAAKKAVEFANKAFKKIRDQIGRSGRSVRHLLRKAVRANPRSNPRVAPQQRETIEFYDLMNHRPSVVESDILMAELGRPSVRQPAWIELRHLFDSGDANTLLCTITGVLGLTNYFEHEEAAGLNGQLNNQTWLPVGNWKGFATFYHLR